MHLVRFHKIWIFTISSIKNCNYLLLTIKHINYRARKKKNIWHKTTGTWALFLGRNAQTCATSTSLRTRWHHRCVILLFFGAKFPMRSFRNDRAWGCKQLKVWDFISLFFALKFDFPERWFSDDRPKRALAETPALYIECCWIVTVLQLQCQTPVISVEERRARRTCWPQQSSSPNWRRSDSSHNNTHTHHEMCFHACSHCKTVMFLLCIFVLL